MSFSSCGEFAGLLDSHGGKSPRNILEDEYARFSKTTRVRNKNSKNLTVLHYL
jgi:hypothetical protein